MRNRLVGPAWQATSLTTIFKISIERNAPTVLITSEHVSERIGPRCDVHAGLVTGDPSEPGEGRVLIGVGSV